MTDDTLDAMWTNRDRHMFTQVIAALREHILDEIEHLDPEGALSREAQWRMHALVDDALGRLRPPQAILLAEEADEGTAAVTTAIETAVTTIQTALDAVPPSAPVPEKLYGRLVGALDELGWIHQGLEAPDEDED